VAVGDRRRTLVKALVVTSSSSRDGRIRIFGMRYRIIKDGANRENYVNF